MRQPFLHVGFGEMIIAQDLIAIAVPNAAPAKRAIQHARDSHRLLDLTGGRQARAVLLLADGSVALAALTPDTIVKRAAET
jgi:extracellular matrix regulatory protein A